MAALDTAMGGIGTGVQPKDLPNQAAASPSAAAQTVSNSLPPGSAGVPPMQGAPPAPAPAPDAGLPAPTTTPPPAPPNSQDQQDANQSDDIDQFLSSIAGSKKKSKEEKKAEKSKDEDIDSFLNDDSGEDAKPGMGLVHERKPGETIWQSLMRRVPEAAKATLAEMRSRIDSNPKNMKIAFESMYGAGNVKTSGDKIMFRPSPEDKFRAIDEKLFGSLTDMILFNAAPIATTAANIGVQGAGAAADLVPGGAMAMGALGGTAETLLKHGIQNAANAASDIPQEPDPIAKDIAWNAGINAAMPMAVKGAAMIGRFGAQQAAKIPVVASLASHISDIVKSPDSVQKLSQINSGLRAYADHLFPEATGKSASEVSEHALGALNKIQSDLGAKVGAIKGEALSLAESQKAKSQMESGRKKIAEELQKRGYYMDGDSGFLTKVPDRSVSIGGASRSVPEPKSGIPGYESALENLSDYHNKLVANNLSSKGTKLEQIFNDHDYILDPASKFSKDIPGEVAMLYQGVRGAVASDRNELMNSVFESSQSPTKDFWQNTYKNFSQNADSVSRVNASFHSPEERRLFVDAYSKAPTAQKNEMINDLTKVLGAQSPELNMFKGGVFNNLINSSVQSNGVVDASKITKALVDPSAEGFIGKLFEPKQVAALNRMVVEGQNISSKYAPNTSTHSGFAEGLRALFKMGVAPMEATKTLFGLTGGNKSVIDYMTDKGFVKLMAQENDPVIKKNIMEALKASEDLVSRMRILDIKTPGQKAIDAVAKKYAPLAGPALSTMIQNTPTVSNLRQNSMQGGEPSVDAMGQ